MRNKIWKEIWDNKGLNHVVSKSDLHVLDGWDVLDRSQYGELINSCLIGSQNFLKGNVRTIEVGCGSGAFIAEIKSKFPEINISGADYSEELLKHARKAHPKVNFYNIDLRSSLETWKSKLKTSKYDVVFSYSVLLYLNNEEEILSLLSNIKEFLNPKGRIILGEINDYDKMDYAKVVREGSHKNVVNKSPKLVADHLYIKKELFVSFAEKEGFKVQFLTLPKWYEGSKYRYHVILKSL